jgi:hypothetical protein
VYRTRTYWEGIAKEKIENGEKSGWRAVSRPERERSLNFIGSNILPNKSEFYIYHFQ